MGSFISTSNRYIYLNTGDNSIKIDIKTGEESILGNGFSFLVSPIIHKRFLIGKKNRKLSLYNTSNNELTERQTIKFTTPCISSQGLVFTHAVEGEIQAFDLIQNKIREISDYKVEAASHLKMDREGTLYFADRNDKVYAIETFGNEGENLHPWPMFGQNTQNTNNPNYKSSPKAQPPQRKWVYKGMGSSLAGYPPIIDENGDVYIESKGSIHKVDANGNLAWKIEEEGKGFHGHERPIINPNGEIFSTKIGNLNKTDSLTGNSKLGIHKNNHVLKSNFSFINSHIIAAPSDGRLLQVIDTKNEKLLWSYNFPKSVSYQGNHLRGNTSTNRHGDIFVIYGKLYSFNGLSGEKNWESDIFENRLRESLHSIDDQFVFCGTDKGIYCFSQKDGQLVWEKDLGDAVTTQPILGKGNQLVVITRRYKVLSINKITGKTDWETTVKGAMKTPAVTEDGQVYVATHDGVIVSLSADNGKKLWELKIDPTVEAVNGNVPSHITLGDEGTIYVGGRSGKLYAFQGTSGPPKDAPWPMFQQNRRNSGNAYDEESQSSKDQPILKWTYETGGSTSELPVIDQHGNAYVSVDEGKIIKLNTKGELDWEAIDPNLRTTKPVLSTSGKIFAIRGGAGSLINAEDGTFNKRTYRF